MQISRFNFVVSSSKNPRLHYLYNSLHDSRLAIEDDEFSLPELFSKVKSRSALNHQEEDAAESLKDLGFFLEDNQSEEQVFKNWINNRVTEQTDVLTVTLLTTLACNLRCTYCYEKDKLGKTKMSDETLDKTIEWMVERIRNTQPRKVNVIFFGGEPLLNLDAIRKFSSVVVPFCREQGVHYSAGAATNGIFLTPKLVLELKQYGFEWVKITFDGDRCEHDQKRVYAGGQGTFDKIFSNLESISGMLKILLGGNFDRSNADSFKGLLQKIDGSKFKKDIVATNFKPIMPEMKKSDTLSGIASSCERCTFTDFEIMKMVELREETRSRGLPATDPINTGPCEFYRRHAVTIGIDGKIYKCIAFLGIEGTEIGEVESQDFNSRGEAMLRASRPFENPKCKTCAFPPICGGGCRADSYNTTGSFENISCQQDYFKKTIAAELPKELEMEVAWAPAMGDV